MEILEVLGGPGRHTGFDRLLVHSHKFAVAHKASRKQVDLPRQIEPSQSLDELLPRLGVPDPVTVGNLGALQQAAIAGEDNADSAAAQSAMVASLKSFWYSASNPRSRTYAARRPRCTSRIKRGFPSSFGRRRGVEPRSMA